MTIESKIVHKELRAQVVNYGRHVDLMLMGHTQTGAALVGVEPAMVEAGEIAEPTIRLRRQEAQSLMDDLWAIGLRPAAGPDANQVQAATERHLKDLREIAFGVLKIPTN